MYLDHCVFCTCQASSNSGGNKLTVFGPAGNSRLLCLDYVLHSYSTELHLQHSLKCRRHRRHLHCHTDGVLIDSCASCISYYRTPNLSHLRLDDWFLPNHTTRVPRCSQHTWCDTQSLLTLRFGYYIDTQSRSRRHGY